VLSGVLTVQRVVDTVRAVVRPFNEPLLKQPRLLVLALVRSLRPGRWGPVSSGC